MFTDLKTDDAVLNFIFSNYRIGTLPSDLIGDEVIIGFEIRKSCSGALLRIEVRSFSPSTELLADFAFYAYPKE